MGTKWRMTQLGELVENFDRHRRPVKSSDRTRGLTPYYGASGIVDYVEGSTHDGDFLLVSEDGENLRSRSSPIAFLARGPFWANNHVHVVRGGTFEETRFLKYALDMTGITGYLTGSAQPKLSRAAMDSILIHTPPLPEQRAIAEVLGALDDKIAANRRVAAINGELADVLYRETRSSARSERLHLGDLVTTQYGITTSAADCDGPLLIRVTDINKHPWIEWAKAPCCEVEQSDLSKYELHEGDIVVARMADPGKPGYVDAAPPLSVFASYLVRLRANDPVLNLYLFHFLRSPEYQRYASGVMSGSVQKNINARVMVDTDVSIPNADLLRSFNERVRALRESMVGSLRENDRLAATRDALLPLLMSGRVRVKDVEDEVGELV